MKVSRIAAVALAAALLLPAGAVMAQDPSPLPSEEATLSPAGQSLYEAFPDEVGGTTLADSIQIMSVGQATDEEDGLELIEAAAAAAGVSLEDIAMGSAFTFDDLEAESGVLIIAVHVPGLDPDAAKQLLLDLMMQDVDEGAILDETVVAGRDVTTLSSADDPEAVAYFYAGGDMAWMVGAPVLEELEEAISKLP